MRDLLNGDYFPFGSQYYRAPSPPPEDWERDLESMARYGFNMVKFWVQWRWNHPAEDQFYFDDIDRLMELADRFGLKVMLNTIVDVAPAWIYQKYPDASMVTRDGFRVGPQTQPHRQIGGLGLCLCHEEAVSHMFRFLRATFERYSDHPALAIWNFGSEPELTQSMAELRLWADDAERISEMMDYNPHSVRAFRKWLEEKRYGSIDALNTAWNRNYHSFDEVEVPLTRNTFNDLVDWRMFFVHVLGENVRRRYELCREVDGGRHPTMCHHVFIQGFPVTSTASDPWNVGQYGDLHGFTQMDDPMMHDILRSCARGKPVLSAEMLMLMGYTLDLPEAISMDDIKRHVFTGIAANLKGFIFWQYRPELLGREAPTWGLTHLDGSPTPWLENFAEVGRVLQEHRDFLFDAEPQQAEVAILYNPEAQVFAWASTGNEKTGTDALLGAHRALYERGIKTDFLHPKDFAGEAAVLDQYRVILVPFAYYLSEEICEKLRAWVEAGGTLIGEAYFGGWYVEQGRHHTTVPGYGLHEVFGVRQRSAEPASEHRFAVYNGVTRLPADAPRVRTGLNEPVVGQGLILSREVTVSGALGRVEIQTLNDLPYLPAGRKACGALAKETFFVDRAEVLATYADGQPAVTRATFGEGTAILIGSYVSLYAHRNDHEDSRALVAGLVETALKNQRPRVIGDAKVRVDVLTNRSEESMIILQNLEQRTVEVAVQVPGLKADELTELFGGESLPCNAGTIVLTLKPREVRVYRS